MSGLLQLAERCEAATGADRDLDRAIWLQLCGPADRQAYEEGLAISKQEAEFRAEYMMDGFRPTASINDAMTLVPEGCVWMLTNTRVYGDQADLSRATALVGPQADASRENDIREAATPALALTAAALRARAALEKADG